nr:unnamed protein product [Naegleria fowleri]
MSLLREYLTKTNENYIQPLFKKFQKDNTTVTTTVTTTVATATTTGVATSVGIPALASLLGFKAGGIASGSIAAWWMSCSAVASGGSVAAGSSVAVMQSIGAVGAVGLTTTVLPLALVTGVVTGAAVYGYQCYDKKKQQHVGGGADDTKKKKV